MKNILIPTDFSDNSVNALRYALDFLMESEATFYVLHVASLSTIATPETAHVHTLNAVKADEITLTKRKS